jgi:hypothetical protein
MTLAPRFLVNFWAGFRVARFVRRLKKNGRGVAAQQAIFAKLMAQLVRTKFGRTHGLKAGATYAQFREAVPPRTYEDFAAVIERMAQGEANVLAPGKCPLFVETAGATGAAAKLLPVPEAMLAHFRAALRDSLFHYAHRVGHCGVFLGRQVHVGASTALREQRPAYRTSFDGLLDLSVTPWVEANLRAPAAPLAQLPEGPAKSEAIARALRGSDVTLLGGEPAALLSLVTAARNLAAAGSAPPPLPTVWPNLECVVHLGAPLGLFGDALRSAVGGFVQFHEIYAAAEGIFAAQDAGNPTALRLLADAGIFFEFLPHHAYHEAALESAGSLCEPLEKIKAGVNYVPVITTPAGLSRYVLGDIVRFVSVDPPRLQVVGRTTLQLNNFSERVTEREVLDTVQAVCARNGWQPIGFHVAPYEQRIGPGHVANLHEWWLELGTHTVKTPMANVLGPEIDEELARRNNDYALRRNNGILAAPAIRLVMPGLFEEWARKQGKTASASKLPRCRSDRLIADQLAEMAPFHQATIAPFRSTKPPF